MLILYHMAEQGALAEQLPSPAVFAQHCKDGVPGEPGQSCGVEQGMLCALTGGRSVVLSLGASIIN